MRALQRVLAATAATMLVAAPAFAATASAVRPGSSVVAVKAGQKAAPRVAARKGAKVEDANQMGGGGVLIGVLAAAALAAGIAAAAGGGSDAVSP